MAGAGKRERGPPQPRLRHPLHARLIAERYGGSLSVTAEDGAFKLDILIPLEGR